MTRIAAIALLPLLAAAVVPAQAAVNLSTRPTKNMNCQDGACVPTAKVATLNVNDLANMLAQSDVKVFTGNGAVTIEVTAPLSWVSANRLTLNAYANVSIKAPVTAAGPGAMTVVTNVAGAGGAFLFFPGGSVSFWDTSSSLIVNGTSYTLVGDLPTLASDIATNPSGAFALAKSYNAFVDGIYLHSPVPTVFHGTFEGLGNTIDQLTIQNPSTTDFEVALFSEAGSGSLIQDVNLTNLSINVSEPQNVGGLVAANRGGVIRNASTAGSISGGIGAGGLVGDNDTTILGSWSSVNVSGASASGGLAGGNLGTIIGSHATGSVSASSFAGGFVGSNGGVITDSYATGAVTMDYPFAEAAGGFAGGSGNGEVYRCFSTGAVNVSAATAKGRTARRPQKVHGFSAGGFVGYGGTIYDSYATGAVTGTTNPQTKKSTIGGFAGQGAGIARTYSTGKVQIDRGFLGGFMGVDIVGGKSIEAAYWDLDTSGVDDHSRGAGNIVSAPGIKGFGTKKFKSSLPKHFDPSVWAESPGINNGYPYLLANPPN